MEEKKEKEKNIRQLLLGFEKLAGEPLVISLLVKEGNVHFIECYSTRVHDASEEEAEEPSKNIHHIKDKSAMQIAKDYIG